MKSISEWTYTDRKIRFVGSTIYYHELHGDTHVATIKNIIGVAGSYNQLYICVFTKAEVSKRPDLPCVCNNSQRESNCLGRINSLNVWYFHGKLLSALVSIPIGCLIHNGYAWILADGREIQQCCPTGSHLWLGYIMFVDTVHCR